MLESLKKSEPYIGAESISTWKTNMADKVVVL